MVLSEAGKRWTLSSRVIAWAGFESLPRAESDRREVRAPAHQPHQHVPAVPRIGEPPGNGGEERGQFPLDVLVRSVARLVAEAEVGVVHLHLPQPPGWAGRGRPAVVAAQLGMRPSRGGAAGPHLLQLAGGARQVCGQFGGAAVGPGGDVDVTLRAPASDLLLWLCGRHAARDGPVDVEGDVSVAERWSSLRFE